MLSSASEESACNAGDPTLIPGSGRSAEGGTVNSPQYSCLENPIDKGTWWTIIYGVTESQTQPLTDNKLIIFLKTE